MRLILSNKSYQFNDLEQFCSSEKLLDEVDAVYINMPLSKRGAYIEKALQARKTCINRISILVVTLMKHYA